MGKSKQYEVGRDDSRGGLPKTFYPTDDPSPEKASFEPDEQQNGDIDLHMKIVGLDAALKKSDVFLFWAYVAPKELNIAQIELWSPLDRGSALLVSERTGFVANKR